MHIGGRMGRVGLIGDNSDQYVAILIELWNKGECAVLIDCHCPPETMCKMLREAEASQCYIQNEYYEKVSCLCGYGVEFLPYSKKVSGAAILDKKHYDSFSENYSDSEAVVIYSSGTTGNAKGVILSHYAIQTNADSIASYMELACNDRLYLAKPLSHSSSLIGELLVALKNGVDIVIAPVHVPPRYAINNIKRFGISVLCLNPTLLSLYADEVMNSKYELNTLKSIYVSGAILRENILEKARRAFYNCSIYNSYGLTEAGPRVTSQKLGNLGRLSVGKTIKGVSVLIVNDYGEIVPKGETGIVHIKTPSLFKGYVKTNSNARMPLCKGWLNSGDIGYIDLYNELHITSRVDDMIVLNSHKIYPSDIENLILETSEVEDCVVTNIELAEQAFIGCLYVSKKDLTEEIRLILKRKLLPYEIPSFFARCENLPKNQNGKIQKELVQKVLLKELSISKKKQRNG